MAFVRPEELVKEFGFEPGMLAADFGSGSGHYVFPVSKLIGDKGIIYAIDIQKDLLQAIKNRAEAGDIKNVEIVWADLELDNGSRLKDNLLDFIIISNILFQSDKKEQIVKEAFRVLKSGGRTAVIEWEKKDGTVAGPALEQRIAKEEAQSIFLSKGFNLEREFQPGDNHYGLIFKKP